MMKVLVVGLAEEIGGIENLFYNLLKEQIENCLFDFLAFGKKCAYEEFFISQGARVYHMPTRKSTPFTFNRKVKKFLIEHNNYDYIWFNTASTSMYQFQYYGKKCTRAKIITHSHGTSIDRNNGILLFGLNKILEIVNRPKVVKNTDLFFCCSIAAGKALYGKAYEKDLILIKNGIEIEKYKFSIDARNMKRKELEINSKTTVLALIGRLSPQKNPIKAIQIYEKYVSKHPDSFLLIVGDGELKKDVISLIREKGLTDRVKMLGFRSDVSEIMSCADILLMPSLFEGLPLTAIEAECNGLKCFLSDTITQETKITDECFFIPITESDQKWVDIIENSTKYFTERKESYLRVLENKYSIDETRKNVRNILLGEKKDV